MIEVRSFPYQPSEHESEKASNAYLMSLVAVVVGLPLPIVNLLATLFFYLSNRKGTYFVRWHCTQALASQLVLLVFNSIGFWWTVGIFTETRSMDNLYFSYIISLVILNLIEFLTTLYTASKTRKGIHVVWWLFGDIADTIPSNEENEKDIFKI